MSAILAIAMPRPAPERRRPRISTTVDPLLLEAVNEWLSRHPGFDRSKVIDEALRLWYAREQERAMEEQFTTPSQLDPHEWEWWRAIRDAAAERCLAGRDNG